MLRNIRFYLCFFPVTTVLTLLAIFFPRTAKWCSVAWSRSSLALAGLTVEADLEELDTNQTYIFMANHQSQLDIPLLFTALAPWSIGFIAKQSLFDIPLFGRAMRNAGTVPIDRTNRRKAMKSVEQAANMVKAGQSVAIFPEGTRATDLSKLQEFKVGGMIIALKTGLPVVPLVITGTGEALPKKKLGFGPTRVIKVKALPPIETEGRYTLKEREKFKDDLYRAMNAAYMEQYNG